MLLLHEMETIEHVDKIRTLLESRKIIIFIRLETGPYVETKDSGEKIIILEHHFLISSVIPVLRVAIGYNRYYEVNIRDCDYVLNIQQYQTLHSLIQNLSILSLLILYPNISREDVHKMSLLLSSRTKMVELIKKYSLIEDGCDEKLPLVKMMKSTA